MKTNLLLSTTVMALIFATGCLKEETPAEAPQQTNPRDALVSALDAQATGLVNGINKVLISGQFFKNMALENPPEEIPLTSDNDIHKAIDYLLSNQATQGQVTTYKPDPRFCTELVAKNHPASCVDVMKLVSLAQVPMDESNGYVEITVGNAKPFTLVYGASAVSLTTQAGEIVKTLSQISAIQVQNGEEDFSDSLPTTHEGELQLIVAQQMGISTVSASITKAIDIQGQHQNGEVFSVQVAPAQYAVTVALDSNLGFAYASLNIPQVEAQFTAKDDQNTDHAMHLQFPGLTGSLNLDNSLAKLAVQAIKLSANDVYLSIDGQPAVHGFSTSQIDAEINSIAGGHAMIQALSPFALDVTFSANPMMSKVGQISASIAQGTQVYFAKDSKQAKILAGSVQVIGTLDFAGSVNAQVNMCIEGNENGALFLQTAVCQ